MPLPRRFLVGILLTPLVLSMGCRKDPPATSVPVAAETPTTTVAEPVVEDVGPSTLTLDLRVVGIWAKIDVPQKTTIVSLGREECLLKCGTTFAVAISRLSESPEAAKTRLTAAGKKGPETTDAGFVEEPEGTQTSRIVWRFFNPYPVGYSLTNSLTAKLNPTQSGRILESIKTFRTIPISVEEMTRSQKAITDLRQVGVLILPRSGGLEIDFPLNAETERLLPRVTELNRVASIRITGNGTISADQLKLIAGCNGLTTLHVRHVSISENDWAALESLASLREIRVESSPSKPAVMEGETRKLLERLSKLPAIRSIVLRRYLVDEAACKIVIQSAKTKLTEVGFEDASLSGRELKFLAEHTKWRGLSLADNPLVNADLINLRDMRELQSLDLSGCKVDDRAPAYLSDSPIVRLKFSRTDLTDKGLPGLLKSFPKLTSLDLSATSATAAGIETLAKFSSLRELNVAHLPVTTKAIEALATCTDLRFLGLANTPLKLADVAKTLETNSRLELLDLRATEADSESVSKFVKAKPDCYLRLEGSPAEEGKLSETAISEPSTVKPLAQLPPADSAGVIKKFDGKALRNEEAESKPIIELTFSSVEMTDADLAQLRDLKTLERLRLDGCKKITEVGLASLGELPALTQLSVAKTSVTPNVCSLLGRFKRLTTLELPDLPISKKHLILLAGLKELESIRGIRVPNQPEAFVDFLASCPNMHRFDWSVIEWNDRRIRKLKALTGLETLEIRGEWQGNGVVELAAGFQNLRELTIQSDLISDLGMKPLDKLTSLRKLKIEGRRFGDALLFPLRNNADLETLRLNCPGFTDRGTVPLRSFQKLLELDLHDSQLGDVMMQNLVDSKDLEWIDLSDTRVTDEGLKFLKGMDELRKLNLSRTAITGIGFKPIASLQRLSRVELNRCRLTKTGVDAIAKVAVIEELDLSDVPVGDDVITSLRELPSLQRLRMNRNTMLTDKIADTLVTFPQLTEVSVIGSKLTAKGLAVLRKKDGMTVIAE